MKIRPLYKNLDTGFVDLSALLRHLRQRGFIGLVRVDIKDYRAEISFDEAHKVRMRELVAGSGRPAEGAGALQRLLVNARVEGGKINVYEAVRPALEEIELDEILDLDQNLTLQNRVVPKPEVERSAPKIPKPAEKISFAPVKNGNGNGNGNGNHYPVKPQTKITREQNEDILPPAFPSYNQPAQSAEPQEEKISYLSAPEWEELTSVTGALLGTADDVLRAANLGFPDAFNKARAEISSEYPFLHPDRGVLLYAHGGVMLKQQVAPDVLVSGVCECLRRILNKLVANPKFFTHYRHITQQIVVLIRRKQPQFDKFGYTRKLEQIIKF